MNAHKLPYGQLEALENFLRAFGVSVPLFTYPLLPEAHKKPTSLSSKALAPVRQCELQTHNTEKPKQISSSGLSKSGPIHPTSLLLQPPCFENVLRCWQPSQLFVVCQQVKDLKTKLNLSKSMTFQMKAFASELSNTH